MENSNLATLLINLLADSYKLMVLTHSYHWNIISPNFGQLHSMFQEQYEELFANVDEIAERLRAIGYYAPGTLECFNSCSKIKDYSWSGVSDGDMIENLIEANEELLNTIYLCVEELDILNDQASLELISRLQGKHEKVIWKLSSSLVY